MERRCPRCRDPLAHVEGEGIVLDHCPSCRGLWLDHDEWQPVVGAAREVRAPDTLELTTPPPCPACEMNGAPRPLQPRGIEGVPGLEIDVCAHCGGAWLDGGELPALRKALAGRSVRSEPRRDRPGAGQEPKRAAAHARSEEETFTFLEALRHTWTTLFR